MLSELIRLWRQGVAVSSDGGTSFKKRQERQEVEQRVDFTSPGRWVARLHESKVQRGRARFVHSTEEVVLKNARRFLARPALKFVAGSAADHRWQ